MSMALLINAKSLANSDFCELSAYLFLEGVSEIEALLAELLLLEFYPDEIDKLYFSELWDVILNLF